MKAKKTTPKSIRFNLKHLEIALVKSNLSTHQELVDFLLEEYVKEEEGNKKIETKLINEDSILKIKLRNLIIDILD